MEISIEELKDLYIESLNLKEKKALKIAQQHLGSTYNMAKSNGFIQFKKEKEKELAEYKEKKTQL